MFIRSGLFESLRILKGTGYGVHLEPKIESDVWMSECQANRRTDRSCGNDKRPTTNAHEASECGSRLAESDQLHDRPTNRTTNQPARDTILEATARGLRWRISLLVRGQSVPKLSSYAGT